MWARLVTGAVLVLTGSCGFTAQTGNITTTSTGSVATLVGPSVQSPALLTSGPYLVTKVVDGDTLWVQRDGQQVRLRLIGSILQRPMIRGNRFSASEKPQPPNAESMLAGHQVLLETDDSQGSVGQIRS